MVKNILIFSTFQYVAKLAFISNNLNCRSKSPKMLVSHVLAFYKLFFGWMTVKDFNPVLELDVSQLS